MARGWRLGIDYGTSNTVAVLQWPDGRTRPLLFDGSPLLPSAVYLEVDGRLMVGRDAERSARLDPARYEPNPKRRIDDGEVLLGDRAVPLVDLVAATLRLVAGEAARTAGAVPEAVHITYPAAWGAVRRGLLLEAAPRAGLPAPTLVPEPVAAAAYFASVLGHRVANGHSVVVYDLGAGTFDVSAVRRQPDGFTVAAVDGMADFGGLDLDAAVVNRVGTQVSASSPQLWQRLVAPSSATDRRHARLLWDDARGVKESLSRQESATLHVPLAEVDVTVHRADLEMAARPPLERAARLTQGTIRDAQITESELAGVFLVGGSSRVPLVAATLRHGVGVPPTVLEQPEIVVAEGVLHAVRPAGQQILPSAPMSPAMPPATPQIPVPAPVSPVAWHAQPQPSQPVSPPPHVDMARSDYATGPSRADSWPAAPHATAPPTPAWTAPAPRPPSPTAKRAKYIVLTVVAVIVLCCGGVGLWQSNLLADPGKFAKPLGPACEYVPEDELAYAVPQPSGPSSVAGTGVTQTSTCTRRSGGAETEATITITRYSPRQGSGGPARAKENFAIDGTPSGATSVEGLGDEANSFKDGDDATTVFFRLDNVNVEVEIHDTDSAPSVEEVTRLAKAIAAKLTEAASSSG